MASKRVVVKKKIVRKKAAAESPVGNARTASPSLRGKRPSVADSDDEGITVGSIIMLLVTLVLIAGVVFVLIPRDISHIKGYPYDKTKVTGAPKNLLRQLEDQLVQHKGTVRFTEEEINNYLNQRLATEQAGLLGGVLKMQGLYADLEPDRITFFVERSMFGLPITIGTSWSVFQGDGQVARACTSTSVGRLDVPMAFDPLIAPFRKMAAALQRESQLLFDEDVRNLKVEKDVLSLEILGE